VKIELLYFEDCPNYAGFLPRLREHFLGSPIEWIRSAIGRAR
jgi:hypothetical protein